MQFVHARLSIKKSPRPQAPYGLNMARLQEKDYFECQNYNPDTIASQHRNRSHFTDSFQHDRCNAGFTHIYIYTYIYIYI